MFIRNGHDAYIDQTNERVNLIKGNIKEEYHHWRYIEYDSTSNKIYHTTPSSKPSEGTVVKGTGQATSNPSPFQDTILITATARGRS